MEFVCRTYFKLLRLSFFLYFMTFPSETVKVSVTMFWSFVPCVQMVSFDVCEIDGKHKSCERKLVPVVML